MVAHRTNSHVFALYYAIDKKTVHDNRLRITSTELIHRMHRVLRLAIGDTCILFDRYAWAEVTIVAVDRTSILCTIIAWHDTKAWHPKITFLLPLLKRESLGDALYNLVQAGVQEIQLIETEKTHHTFGAKEMERFERIIIAAAEQSKNFAFPNLKAPISWSDALLLMQKTTSYVGDPLGKPIIDTVCKFQIRPDHCLLLVGPEGDFTTQEWEQLTAAHVVPLQLTPTILKAETAAFYLAALFRSLFLRQ